MSDEQDAADGLADSLEQMAARLRRAAAEVETRARAARAGRGPYSVLAADAVHDVATVFMNANLDTVIRWAGNVDRAMEAKR